MALGRLGIGGATDAGGLFTIFGSVRLQGVDDAVNGFGKLTNSASKSFNKMTSTAAKWGTSLEKAFGGANTKAGKFGLVLGSVAGVAASAGTAFLKLGANLVMLEAKMMAAAVGGAATLIMKFEQLGTAAANAASSVVEAANVVDLAFGDGASSSWANDWASSLLTSQGISRGKALQGLGTIGEIFLGSGVTDVVGTSRAEEMSKSVIEMAGDFASVFNKTTDETLTLIQSGLRGNTQAIEQLGISMLKTNLNDYVNNTLQARYAGTGLFESNTETGWKWASGTGTEQNIAAYEYIREAWEKMNVAGDFERTRDSLSNLNRTLEETKTSLLETFGMSFMQSKQNLLIPLRDVSTALVEDLIKAEGNWDAQMDVLNSYMPEIMNWAGTDVPNYIMDITQKMRDIIGVLNNSGAGQAVSNILEAVGASIGTVLGPMGEFLKTSLVQPAYDYLMEHKDEILEKAATTFETALEKMRESGILSDVGEAIGVAIGSTAPDFAWGFLQGLGSAIKTMGLNIAEWLFTSHNTDADVESGAGITAAANDFSTAGWMLRDLTDLNTTVINPFIQGGEKGANELLWKGGMPGDASSLMSAIYASSPKGVSINGLPTKASFVDIADVKEAVKYSESDFAEMWKKLYDNNDYKAGYERYKENLAYYLAAANEWAAESEEVRESGAALADGLFKNLSKNFLSQRDTDWYVEKLRGLGIEGSTELMAAINRTIELNPELDTIEFWEACYKAGIISKDQLDYGIAGIIELNPTLSTTSLEAAAYNAGLRARNQIIAAISGEKYTAAQLTPGSPGYSKTAAADAATGGGFKYGQFAKGGVFRKLASGGIIDRATMLGRMSNGAMIIGGEAGAEAVAPISELQGYIAAAVRAAGGYGNQETLALLQQILAAIPSVLTFESGVVAAQLAPAMNREINFMKARGMV